MRRMAKKQRRFDLIVLDPPTFSRSKQHGTFQVEKDYGRLMSTALPLLNRKGVMLASTNAATFKPEAFLDVLSASVRAAGRTVIQQHYSPQPPDFPVSREEPAYLKTVWLRLD
jgi:23S rRNA (cytosine1962-C5)-methyltransferase